MRSSEGNLVIIFKVINSRSEFELVILYAGEENRHTKYPETLDGWEGFGGLGVTGREMR
jgi:hypothetical protein